MLPSTASAAVVVNATVTGTRALAATRSPAAMLNTTPVGCVDIAPDGAPAEATVSAPVDTVMLPVGLPAVAAPIVRPERVMAKAVAAGMPATLVEMTMELPVMTDVAVINPTDVEPTTLKSGLGVAAKNPAG